ncbi:MULTISPECIES: bifunctional riboflavin kinase/FAD synthetase [unclassified Gilliamella]|uniref:bifunctional riboflavin kinase/FAD synthetase n=1 Tax=unclassified Gilliamella TaxID=2685620 RepID=UPI001C698F9C|nr:MULTISPECIES: bifunctional riboflavin kinase/FAD synthetase [unclassified Gilliamella]MCX8584130.1 bifunctional riboflavin kinase/FAD synthetase [Gilliamella sp. B3372]MCX8586779.1 bifunctional riboflavin kinase/FAD synthetase [Gilliamella sp. B3562]MCX8595496.1 bifunctional riboflavin kinase/FAD synthetase [Gilliamella sp. B3367]MCX8663670.1 bifunctional riboflavin kinase/FAD synthetase [Gilliamella sp. B2911]MCX8671819.1 bifunctional riboflavin kinase/FAD synthetase [Gilliamella sp. B2785
MKIIRGIDNLNNQFTQCVLTLGNFDGVHLGHQQLINHLIKQSKKLNLPTVVMLFEPQPLEFFCKQNAPARLTSFKEKVELIKKLGIDYIIAVPFTQTFANMLAPDFIQDWLINKLQAKYIVIGDDFRFGRERKGDINLLQQYTHNNQFVVESMPTFVWNDLRISSTAVREALFNSDFKLAHCLLGRNYAIEGKVVHGNALARQLGFPTANIHLNRKKPALQGVYFVKVKNCCSNQHYHGIANIGIRPTIEGKKAILEVNLFDFSGDIYGQYLDVIFVHKLRDEKKFDSLTDLKQQIAQDVCTAKQISAKLTN